MMTINYTDLQSMFDRAFSEHMEARATKMLKRGTFQPILNTLATKIGSEHYHPDKVTGIARVYHDEKTNENVYIVYGRDITKGLYEPLNMVLTGETAYVVFIDNIAKDYKNVDGWPLHNLMAICEFVTDLMTAESILWAMHMAEEFDRSYMPTICELEGYQHIEAVYKDLGATLQDSIVKFYEDYEFNRKVRDAYDVLCSLPLI